MYMCDTQVIKRVCLSLVDLSLAHLIYGAPAGELKMDRGRDFSSLT